MPRKLSPATLARAIAANPRWAQRLGWQSYTGAIAALTAARSLDAGAPAFALAVASWQARRKLVVDGILGPTSWALMRRELGPPDSPTGIRPPDAPPVPDGFDAIVATFGDPRPLLEPDGTMSDTNRAVWERQTLARGHLPFRIPIDPANPEAGTAGAFAAHRRLTGVFEAVFQELDRLGLRGAITSWGGIYNFRSIRGVQRLSLHAFGAAVDLNAETNALGTPGDMDPRVIEVFRHFGFFWGGDFHGRPDPMHFQYATGY